MDCSSSVEPQAPLPMGFSRQEYWRGLSFPSPGDLPDPGIKPASLVSPALAGGLFTTSATWESVTFPSGNKIGWIFFNLYSSYICVCVCVYICVCIYIYVCIYIHTYPPSQLPIKNNFFLWPMHTIKPIRSHAPAWVGPQLTSRGVVCEVFSLKNQLITCSVPPWEIPSASIWSLWIQIVKGASGLLKIIVYLGLNAFIHKMKEITLCNKN